MTLPLVLLVALTTAPTPDPDTLGVCADLMVPYRDRGAQTARDTALDLAAPGGGHLTYLGAEHSRDPAHPQVAWITEAWAAARPTVAFYEGPARPTGATAEETLAAYGESGYVRYLAEQAGVRIERLEPGPQAEIDALRGSFPLDQVKLFFVLREAARLRDREGLAGAALDAAVTRLLGAAATLLGEAFGASWALDDLTAAYHRHWSDPADWREAPARWFTPDGDPRETGGRFMHAVNRASSEARDRHMATVLAEAARRGERVFAVVGRDHVPAQAAALRCALAE